VLARILLGIAAGGYVFSPAQAFLSIGTFLGVFLGGALVGWILALAFGWLLGRVETDPFIEISLTTVLAYASFLIAEEVFHVSGVMATVAAGLTIGGWGRAKISAAVSEYLDSFWEYLAFVANALIFLLVGLRVDLGALVGSLDILAWVILAMLISRAVVTFGLIPLAGRLPNAEKITVPYQAVMYWGGLRGAIGLALALSLGDFPQAEIFVAVVMGVVLFTLVVQGLTVGMLVHWLGLDRLQLEDKVARTEGMLSAKHRAAARIPGLQKGGLFSARIGEKIEARLGNGIDDLESDLKNLRRGEFDRDQERRLLMGRVFLAEKQIYYDLFTKGHFSEPSYRELCLSVDTQIAVLRNDGKLPGTTLWSFWSRPIRIMAAGATSRLPLLGALADRIRRFYIIIDYEEDWGRYQGSTGVLEDLDNFAFAESTPADLVAEVRVLYEGWRDSARGRIDGLAEQFPEFVDAMQERLAERLVILAEREIIEAQVQSGSIPQAVAEAMLKELAAESRSLRGSDTKHLRIEPSELLRKVPFFADTPAAEVDRVIKPLRLLTVPAGQSLIVEGSKDRSLYLIARGVVRVSKNSGGGSQDVATLIAGDFFGEMALLRGVARTATCRAVTPCAVYKLSRKDFDRVRTTCPTVQAALEAVDLQRRSGLV
ncbi:MAG: cyclic nucleotide-binding domain-containing protein, partial [Alphaproteobacteria bacterium]|nr:cyclic nucleotide-binding domain-containing protein [Alphaproteobacteria bacterium]